MQARISLCQQSPRQGLPKELPASSLMNEEPKRSKQEKQQGEHRGSELGESKIGNFGTFNPSHEHKVRIYRCNICRNEFTNREKYEHHIDKHGKNYLDRLD